MDCADAKLRMEPCASGALVPQELALFEEHIAACEGCRLELELVRAMGSTDKPVEPKSDDWTLDRIFGAEASKSPAASSAPALAPEPPPAPEPAPEPAASPAPVAETFPSEPERLALDPLTAGADASDAPNVPPSDPEPSEAAMIFESTPNPMPPEPSPSAEAAPVGEPAAAASTLDDAPAAMAAKAANSEKTTRASAGKRAESGDSWEFEPADAKPEASLPEGSLFFAEETLARQGNARKGQNSMKRVVLWGSGAVVGIGLLALSLWIGFFSRQGDSDLKLPLAGAGAPVAPDSSAAADSAAGAASDVNGEAAPSAGAPDVVTTRADEVIAKPPAIGARALSGTGVPPLPGPSKTGSASVAPRSTTGAPAATKQPTGTSGTTSVAPKQTPKAASGMAPRQVAAADTIDPEQALLRAPPPYSEQDIPFTSTKTGDGRGTTTTKAPAKSPTPPTVSKPAEPAPDSAPPADAVQRPIDRLHLATVGAEQADDLVTLRKLRDTWKGLVKTSVGPDRARAKRELGDCYWAIQKLTGRTSDKKNALAAYREYLLNAPAGGADPRTVARMRQLEDALAESK